MIKFLRVRNLATIEDVHLDFEPGFSILTGETGAGKSIVIDAIRLILGEKSSPDSVRTGASEASVEAALTVPDEDDPADDGREILVQRLVSGQGPGKAYIDGILAPVRKLRDAVGAAVDIYGQNDHVFLLHIENHLQYLDAFAGSDALGREVARSARALKSLCAQKQELESRRREREQQLDFLTYQIGEIEDAGLKPGEDEELARSREIGKNAEKIAGLLDQALDASYAQEESILPLLARFKTVLKELVRFYPDLEGSLREVEDFSIVLRETSHGLMTRKDANSGAAENLEAIEARLNTIDKLKRKYGPEVQDILAHLGAIRTEAKDLVSGRERLEGLEKEIAGGFSEYASLAGKLTDLRKLKGPELERIIEKEIARLGMKNAAFRIEITTVPPSLADPAGIRENGADEAEFLISPNPGEELRPLRKIASGGELSRVMLALKSVGKDRESAKTLIFDEIDAGIGGRTAEFIAEKLTALAGKHQVLCITHLPQIAAAASRHILIEKKVEKQRTFTTARKLDPAERVREIARLISGSRQSDASLQTAREMLAGSAAEVPKPGRRGGP
ncbi:MAG: DNA repair protein RecN [Candidatus Aminicenantales bacterium]